MRWSRIILTALLISRSFTDGREGTGRSPNIPLLRSARSADDECTWNLTVKGSGGTITSPDYPNNYPSNVDCRWLLRAADPNATIYLRIDSLNIEPDTDCKLDYLQVYLGTNALAPSLGPFCGTINDRVLKTNSTTLLLVFHSDPVYEDKGFSIDYFTQTIRDCETLLTAGAGSLRSPGFPDNYPDNTDCWTQITVAQNKKILFFFDSLDMEYGENCTFDYVQIFDGSTRNSTLLGQVCQHSAGMTNFDSSSNSLLIHFHSDDSVNKKGYRARYSSIDKRSTPIGECLWETEENNGTIASPNYPANYPSFSNCSIWVQAQEGERIFITFDALQLEIDTNCTYDYLKITEGPPSDSKVLGNFCGRGLEPTNLTTSSNEVMFEFISDDFAEFSGFKLRYWFIKNDTENERLLEKKSPAVERRLEFDEVPQNATLSVGSSFMLHCRTTHPNAKIRWLKGDRFLAGGTPLPGLKVLSNNTLWIQSMDHHLSGIYSCVAVSPEETITAKAYALIKNGAVIDSSCGIVFLKTPKDSSFAEGEFVHMECKATGEHVQLSWEKDGQPLQIKKHMTVLKNGYIFMDKVKLDDAGVYSCVAKDAVQGCTKKASALLQISQRAKIDEICGKPKMGQPSKAIPQMDHGKILGGHNAKKGAYPWQVMLWEPTLKSFCGGTLLNERWIATAAHCFINYENLRWDRVIIKLGKYDRQHMEEQEFRTSIADYSSIVVHPAYSKLTFDNDLALVRLRDHVRFTDYILPACLGDRDLSESLLNSDSSNKMRLGTVIGWGKLKEDGPSPRFLQEIKLPVVDQESCMASTNYTVSRNMFCAGYTQEIVGDACHGDSGGPFLMSRDNKWYLAGIVSWGEGCGKANKYGFYTRIPNYIPWIKGIIKS